MSVLRDERNAASAASGVTSLALASKLWSLAQGATLDVRVFQSSGGALDTGGAGGNDYYLPFLEALYIGPLP